jgi:2-polyprenyl-3-methyl-5-hydroxy-6-metoxy-1,4-benzoquinol methylase
MTEYAYSGHEPTWSDAYVTRKLREVLQRVAPPPARVFELGCGNGATARSLAAEGYSVTGVDPSASGINIAKQFESEQLRFAVGSTSDDLAGQHGQFPVVLSLEVIEHCPSAREFMRAFSSLVVPGGTGILSTPYHGFAKNLAIVASGNFDRHFDPLWEGGHLRFFSLPKLRQLFEEAGFRSVEFYRLGRIPMLAKTTLAVGYK